MRRFDHVIVTEMPAQGLRFAHFLSECHSLPLPLVRPSLFHPDLARIRDSRLSAASNERVLFDVPAAN